MSISKFTIKNATFTIDSATKYRFDNNICYHILLRKRFSVLMWYQCEEHHMFILLSSYDSDNMDPPATREEFSRGMAEKDTMYWFSSPHLDIFELQFVKKKKEIIRLAIPYEEDVIEVRAAPWELPTREDCLGIYHLQNDTMYLVHKNHVEAFESGIKVWKPMGLVVLEWDKKDDLDDEA